MSWSDYLFEKSTKQRDGITTPSKRRLKSVTTPGNFKGIAVGDLEKYNLKKSKTINK